MADGTTITIEAQSTAFSRAGNTQQQMVHTANDGGPNMPIIGLTLGTVFNPTFTPAILAGLAQLSAVYNIPLPDLSATDALYDNQFLRTQALVQSGPDNVRGGTARTGFAIAELGTQQALNRYRELWGRLVGWAQMVIEAVSKYNSIVLEQTSQSLRDHELTIMAGHVQVQSVLGGARVLVEQAGQIVQAYAAAKQYGNATMTVLESMDGEGMQVSGAAPGFGQMSWR